MRVKIPKRLPETDSRLTTTPVCTVDAKGRERYYGSLGLLVRQAIVFCLFLIATQGTGSENE